MKKFAQCLKRDALEGVRYRDDRLQISPVRTIATPDAEGLADRHRCHDASYPHHRAAASALLSSTALAEGLILRGSSVA